MRKAEHCREHLGGDVNVVTVRLAFGEDNPTSHVF